MTRHRFDPFSFIAGGVAIGVALAVLLGRVTISLVDLRIAGPVLILVLGLALLLSGSGRDRVAAVEDPDVDAAPPAPTGDDTTAGRDADDVAAADRTAELDVETGERATADRPPGPRR